MSSLIRRFVGVGLLLALGLLVPPPDPASAQAFVPRAVEAAEPEAAVPVRVDAPLEVFGVSSARSQITSEAQTLRIALNTGDRAACLRRLTLDAPVQAVLCRFNLSVSGEAGVSQVLRVGAGLGTSAEDSPDAATYARLGVVTVAAGSFQIRDLVGRRTSPSFEGTQALSWALNNSGRTLTYAAPDGSVEAVADDRMDLWVGRRKVFDDMAVTMRGGSIAELKWYWGAGTGVTTFDHLTVEALDGADAAALGAVSGDTPVIEAPPGEAPLELYRPTPNPFERTMRFAYAIPNGIEAVDIGVFDVTGRRVRSLVEERQQVGVYEVQWDGRADGGARVKNGVYFLRASIGTQSRVARVVYLMK